MSDELSSTGRRSTRRQTLVGLAGIAGLATTSGCLGSTLSGRYGTPPDDWPTPGDSDTEVTPELPPGDPAHAVQIGQSDERDGEDAAAPHRVVVRNGSDEPRRVAVRVTRRDREHPLGERRLRPDETLVVGLFPPGGYVVFLRDLTGDHRLAVGSADRNWFDCNDSWTTLVLTDGGIGVTGGRTTVACGPF
ncbi:hypothetical protein RYH80_06445 [Halobaculum sp. MBLA0147]|uniref:hypothetical protein n=1 Tax=Halobaculum sp. MBLA0147 TaxID=3079934 RepID=UPI003523633E